MKVIITNARLIEDGVVVNIPIDLSARTIEATCSQEALKRLETFRNELTEQVMEESREDSWRKEGAIYTIDFAYTFQE